MGISRKLQSIWAGLSTSFFYVFRSFKKDIKSLLVGVFTVFLSVCFLCILQNAVKQVPSIFMRISETNIGEGDISITNNLGMTLNYTDLKHQLENCTNCKNIYPRWMLYATIHNGDLSNEGVLNVYDSEYEYKENIGRGWKYDPLQEDEIVINKEAAERIGLKEGQYVDITLDLKKIMEYMGIQINETILDNFGMIKNITFGLPLELIFGADATNGKQIITSLYEIEKKLNETGKSPITSFYINGLDMYVYDAYWTYVVDIFADDPYEQFEIIDGALQITAKLQFDFNDKEFIEKTKIIREMKVKGIAESAGGKYSTTLGNVISIDVMTAEKMITDLTKQMVEYELHLIIDFIKEFYPITDMEEANLIDDVLNNVTVNMKENALNVYLQFTKRNEAYYDGDMLMKKYLTEATDEIMNILGLDSQYSLTAPLSLVVSLFNYLMYLLQQIFNFVVIVFAFMGGLLIYSLLISDVESKTYEFGMLRALGLLKKLLIEILVIESTTFSIIGVILGLILGYLGSLVVNYTISSLACLPMPYEPSWQSIVLPFCLGFIIPLIANIVPIKQALSKTLRNALDLYHSVVNEVNVTIKKLKSLGVNTTFIVIGVVMILYSFMTYYIIPMSFMEMKLDILFTCFLMILLAFLIGLCLISQIFQPIFQYAITYIIVPLNDAVRSIILKNLNSHSRRNNKTVLMLTVAVSFVLFAGGAFSLSKNTLTNTIRLQTGADVQIKSTSGGLDVDTIKKYLDNETYVVDYSFVTSTLANSQSKSSNTQFGNVARYPFSRYKVIAVDEHYTNTVYNDLILPVHCDDEIEYDLINGKKDVIGSLYKHPRQRKNDLPINKFPENEPDFNKKYPDIDYFYQNYTDVIVSEGLREQMSLRVGDNIILQLTKNNYPMYFLGKVRATVKAMPGQSMSSFYSTSTSSNVIISLPQYQELMKVHNSVYNKKINLIYSTCYIKVKPDTQDYVVQDLRQLMNNASVTISNTVSSITSISSSIDILQVFFIVVSLLTLVLCFFVMLLSFTSNVNENAWEFAVLRAIGFSSTKVISIYILEAFSLALSSIILGSIIGIGIAAIINLQFVVFLQLPYIFSFPWMNAIIVYSLALVVSFAASFIPAWSLTRKPISNVLKGNLN